MKVWMIRHPETTANRDKIIYGRQDYPYTPRGEQQEQWVVDWIREVRETYGKGWNFKMITSPRGRAKVLAGDLGKVLETEVEEDERLTEMNFGCLEGLTYEEVKNRYPKVYEDFYYHFDTMHIPEGESYEAFVNRLEAFYAHRLAKDCSYWQAMHHQKEQDKEELCLILVTHGAVLRHFMEKMLQLNPGDSWKFNVINGTIIQYRWNQSWSLEGMIPCRITEV